MSRSVAAVSASAPGTPPKQGPTAWCHRFLASDETQAAALTGKAKDPELAALTNLCQQLLASNEFLYVD